MSARNGATIVLVLFDAKNKPKASALPLQPDAGDLICYLTRLAGLEDEHVFDQRAIANYLVRDGALGAFAAKGFHTGTLAGIAREFALDVRIAGGRARPALSHGCISLKLPAGECPVTPTEFLEVGHRAMELLGVQQNRYVLAVHIDSGHLHLHFLHSRVTEGGAIRERDRKMSKFLCEEACAVLAHEFGLELEKRHLSRADNRGVLDLASQTYTRDAHFNERVHSAKRRTKARRRIAAMPKPLANLARLATVARYKAHRNLDVFRSLLAEDGISYQRRGSGAVFIDADGTEHKASAVGRRFSPDRIGMAGVASMSLPDEPQWITAKIEQRRHELAVGDDLVPEPDPQQEWDRFQSARNRDQNYSRPPEQQGRIDHDIKRSFRANTAGRPRKDPLPEHWPPKTMPTVSLGGRTPTRRQPNLPRANYNRLVQPWQTEFWRGSALVATVRYSVMTIYSKEPVDLEAALKAAHEAWGDVEVFGNQRFKAQMVTMAAKLDVPIVNPDLQKALRKAREKMGKPATLPMTTLHPEKVEVAVEPTTTLAPDATAASNITVDDTPTKAVTTARQQPDAVNTSVSTATIAAQGSRDVEARSHPLANENGSRAPALPIDIGRLLIEFDGVDRPVIRELTPPHRYNLTTRDPAYRLLTDIVDQPEVQRGLETLHAKQQGELEEFRKQVTSTECSIECVPDFRGMAPPTFQPAARNGTVFELFRRYQSHPECALILERAWQEQEARNQQRRGQAITSGPGALPEDGTLPGGPIPPAETLTGQASDKQHLAEPDGMMSSLSELSNAPSSSSDSEPRSRAPEGGDPGAASDHHDARMVETKEPPGKASHSPADEPKVVGDGNVVVAGTPSPVTKVAEPGEFNADQNGHSETLGSENSAHERSGDAAGGADRDTPAFGRGRRAQSREKVEELLHFWRHGELEPRHKDRDSASPRMDAAEENPLVASATPSTASMSIAPSEPQPMHPLIEQFDRAKNDSERLPVARLIVANKDAAALMDERASKEWTNARSLVTQENRRAAIHRDISGGGGVGG